MNEISVRVHANTLQQTDIFDRGHDQKFPE